MPAFYARRFLSVLALVFFAVTEASGQVSAAPEKAIIAVPSPALSMLPVFFAQDSGLFEKEGIEPVIVSMSGGLQAVALGDGPLVK